MLFVPRGSTAARLRLRVTVLDRAAAAACGGSRPIRRPDAAAVHQLVALPYILVHQLVALPPLVHQLVALPYILQMGPRQAYPGPRQVYPRRRSRCTVLPAVQKC
jgi:hypothetical protein